MFIKTKTKVLNHELCLPNVEIPEENKGEHNLITTRHIAQHDMNIKKIQRIRNTKIRHITKAMGGLADAH